MIFATPWSRWGSIIAFCASAGASAYDFSQWSGYESFERVPLSRFDVTRYSHAALEQAQSVADAWSESFPELKSEYFNTWVEIAADLALTPDVYVDMTPAIGLKSHEPVLIIEAQVTSGEIERFGASPDQASFHELTGVSGRAYAPIARVVEKQGDRFETDAGRVRITSESDSATIEKRFADDKARLQSTYDKSVASAQKAYRLVDHAYTTTYAQLRRENPKARIAMKRSLDAAAKTRDQRLKLARDKFYRALRAVSVRSQAELAFRKAVDSQVATFSQTMIETDRLESLGLNADVVRLRRAQASALLRAETLRARENRDEAMADADPLDWPSETTDGAKPRL